MFCVALQQTCSSIEHTEMGLLADKNIHKEGIFYLETGKKQPYCRYAWSNGLILLCQRVIEHQWRWDGNILAFSVISVPADDQAPLGARISPITLVTKFGSGIYTGPVVKGLTIYKTYIGA